MPRAAFVLVALAAFTGCATLPDAPAPRDPIAAPVPARSAAPTRTAAANDARPGGDPDLPDTTADAERAPPDVGHDDALATGLEARLAARARTFLGQRGPFRVAGSRFKGDCSGLAQAVYMAEGVDLTGLMQQTAPDERVAVKAQWLAAGAHGKTFGAETWPRPGDLVFWHDTYDRNRNGRADDPLTHVGIVEYVEDGSVFFIHRGAKGAARGVMTPGSKHDGSAPDRRRLNSILRARSHPVRRGGLAAELFAGYGRLDVADGVANAVATESPAAEASEIPAPDATETTASTETKTSTRAAGSRSKRKASPAAVSKAKRTRRTSVASAKASRASVAKSAHATGRRTKKNPALSAKPSRKPKGRSARAGGVEEAKKGT